MTHCVTLLSVIFCSLVSDIKQHGCFHILVNCLSEAECTFLWKNRCFCTLPNTKPASSVVKGTEVAETLNGLYWNSSFLFFRAFLKSPQFYSVKDHLQRLIAYWSTQVFTSEPSWFSIRPGWYDFIYIFFFSALPQ